MPRMIDLAGRTYGRLTVVEKRSADRYGNVRWVCKCSCGSIVTVASRSLKTGNTRSCGCLGRELSSARRTTHGHSGSRIHNIWLGIKSRCLNPNEPSYKDYGGRGILICDEWLSFQSFYHDMREGYSDSLTIDRKDNNGNYCKENCRWATYVEQNNNRRNNRIITFNKKSMTLQEWANAIGVTHSTLVRRLDNWAIEKALSQPKSRA